MSPEERALLERTLKLSEDNNEILKKLQRVQKRAAIYGFIKLMIIVLPLIAGYIYLEPYLNQAVENFQSLQQQLSR
jgi:hypothetical protein